MDGDGATPDGSAASRRLWAWTALAALAGLVVAVVALVARGGDTLVGLVLAGALYLLLAVAASWWAFTTSKPWKRWLNVALIALLLFDLATEVVAFWVWQPAGVLAIIVAALGYDLATRRALGGAAPQAPAVTRSIDVTPPARPWLLVNRKSGGGTAERVGLVDAARDRGIHVHVLAPGDDPTALARQAVTAGADAVGVAGGDGSLGRVAAVAVELGVPFICVPAGTRNHFAYDLGLDRADPLAALGAFAGAERRVDVGLVGDRLFLNNVSLGAYADLVADARYRERKLATAHVVLPGAIRGEGAPLELAFRDPDGRWYEDVLVLLVANNRYVMQQPAAEAVGRTRLDDGVLQVSALQARTGAALAAVAATVVTGRDGTGALAQWETTALRVDSRLPRLPAGVDGEAVVLTPPLEFRVKPRALRVLVPATLAPRATSTRALSRLAVRRLWKLASGRSATG